VSSSFDLTIVGGGILGLATARELLGRHPRLRVAVLEKEPRLGEHQSGHNSGVIHSGLYYAPGSLKARLCAEGRDRMYAYCDEHGIPYQRCGKLVVALDESELPRLEDLYRRGIANGVPGLEMVGPDRLREIEPHSAGVKAIWSPVTGIVDFRRVVESYAEEVRQRGGEIRTEHEVTGIARRSGRVLLRTVHGILDTQYLVTCAGLQSDRIARLTGGDEDPKIVPFRGDYFTLHPDRRHLVKGMIYPVPDPAFPFLGVHFTLRMDGEVWLGPNAVLAFAREGYSRYHVNPADLLEALTYRGFRALARKYWRTGLGEMVRDYNKAAFVRELQRYMPELRHEDVLPGPSGVRAQALSGDGKMVDDFVISADEHVIHVRNAPSPAATSSLAIGRELADMADARFTLDAADTSRRVHAAS
jgi:(S)-2-hydroxyglutarate dehydrogenase